MSWPTVPAPPPFRPLPFLGGGHRQTLAGQYWPDRPRPLPATQRMIAFPDGDQAAVFDSQPDGWTNSAPLVALVHGMGGSHQSGYLRRLAARLFLLGCRVLRIDLRGCGASMATCKKIGHGGCSSDVRHILETIQRDDPDASLYLVGFSLGGNVVARMLAEAGTAPLPRLVRAVVINPPIDMEACSRLLQQPRNRLYERYFIKDLWRQARHREKLNPEQKAPSWNELTTLRRFDDLYTAPLSGFRDAAEYYAFASSASRAGQIRVPTLFLTSRDDPFIAVEPFEALPKNEWLKVEIAPGGGHLGFLGKDGRGGFRWADQRILRYLAAGD